MVIGIAFAVTALPSRAAAAVVDPLLVVVETAPGAAVNAAEVRQAIAAELGMAVRAPRDPAEADTHHVLIVAVDRAEIRMSLRAGASGGVSRAMPAPGDRKARLQSIGWLAGNLVRDQVGAIVAPVPAPALVSEAIEVEPASRAEVPQPAPSPRPATDPPPFADNGVRGTGGASGSVVATRPSPAAPGGTGPAWSLTLAGGPTAFFQGGPDSPEPVWPSPGVYYLELQRRASTGLIFGVALDVGPDMSLSSKYPSPSVDFIGAAASLGGGRRFRRTFVEATVGLGVEAFRSTRQANMTESQRIAAGALGLYIRGQATAGLALSTSFELLASVGAHLGSAGRWDSFFTTSLGVRFRFQ